MDALELDGTYAEGLHVGEAWTNTDGHQCRQALIHLRHAPLVLMRSELPENQVQLCNNHVSTMYVSLGINYTWTTSGTCCVVE